MFLLLGYEKVSLTRVDRVSSAIDALGMLAAADTMLLLTIHLPK